jgi:CID domain
VLGKYLASFSKAQDALSTEDVEIKRTAAAACRRRLHVLYLLNDLLHHTKYHTPNSSQFSTFGGAIQPFLVDLVQLAAIENRPKIRTRINNLLQIWQDEAYFSKDYVDKLREAATNSAMDGVDGLLSNGGSTGKVSDAKQQPYVMPPSHGDPSTPYHDLPAGNIMPHIMPNRSVPIRPEDVRALQFVAGPADEALVIAVKDFMKAVAEIDTGAVDFGHDEGTVEDIDDLGQDLLRDETGELVAGRTYYGWSRDFCDKMKSRGEGKGPRSGRERSHSSSRSQSRSPRKRRRYSNSVSSSSSSYSRSPSRSRLSYNKFRDGRREYSPSDRGRHENRSRTRTRSYSPSLQPTLAQPDAPAPAAHVQSYQMPFQEPRPPGYPNPQAIPPPPSMLPPNMSFSQHGFPPPPIAPGGLPIPPPPPANYSGPWPPPPPPLSSAMGFNSAPGMQPHHASQGFPKASPYQGGQQQYGRSGSNRWQN